MKKKKVRDEIDEMDENEKKRKNTYRLKSLTET